MKSACGYISFAALLLAVSSCATPAPTKRVAPVSQSLQSVDFFDGIFSDDMDWESLARAAEESIKYLSKLNPDTLITVGDMKISPAQLMESAKRLSEIVRDVKDPALREKVMRAEFQVYSISGRKDGGNTLVTGYYQPELRGSRTEKDNFKYPIYKKPDDLIVADLALFDAALMGKRITGRVDNGSLKPYYSRKDIDGAKSLAGRGLEIAWVDDPVELFKLHVQGSGIVRFEDGSRIFVNFAGGNGHGYKSIGKLLIDEGAIKKDEMTMQAIEKWFAEHPGEVDRVLDSNPSYVFFREMNDGPFGSTGAKLVAGRSAAMDPSVFPPGIVAHLTFEEPVIENGAVTGWRKTGRFVFNHDKGAAIKGAGRLDLFMGAGANAAAAAGVMKREGNLAVLLIKHPSGNTAGSR